MIPATFFALLLFRQVAGEWTFFLSEPTRSRTKCGHQSPDAASAQPGIDQSSFPNQLQARGRAIVGEEQVGDELGAGGEDLIRRRTGDSLFPDTKNVL